MKKLSLYFAFAVCALAPASAFAQAGAFCGGIAGIQCPAGFECELAGTYPDAGGQCVESALFCGGIAGIECPRGYECELEGDYPDAGGECVEGPSFCGGIAGIPCPTGYECKLDGTYPDAGGECVKRETGAGLLQACGLYGPHCATGLKCVIPRWARGINPQGICWYQ